MAEEEDFLRKFERGEAAQGTVEKPSAQQEPRRQA